MLLSSNNRELSVATFVNQIRAEAKADGGYCEGKARSGFEVVQQKIAR